MSENQNSFEGVYRATIKLGVIPTEVWQPEGWSYDIVERTLTGPAESYLECLARIISGVRNYAFAGSGTAINKHFSLMLPGLILHEHKVLAGKDYVECGGLFRSRCYPAMVSGDPTIITVVRET